MSDYREQLEIALSYRVREGGHYRGDCPFCHGRNTYGVALQGGTLKWGCFKASCDVGGVQGGDLSSFGILAKVNGTLLPKALLAPVPTMLTPASTQPFVMSFLEVHNCLPAYNAGLVDVRYSPQEDRVMFPVGEPCMGWTGRARRGIKPKWRKYGDCSSLFSCGIGRIAVLVEDALSACAVGALPEYTGTALLGTILSSTHIIKLRTFDRVFVALDPDAMSKGLEMVGKLAGTVPTSLRLIPNDLKYYTQTEIKRILTNDGED